jgi:hypothetical protein
MRAAKTAEKPRTAPRATELAPDVQVAQVEVKEDSSMEATVAAGRAAVAASLRTVLETVVREPELAVFAAIEV